MIYSYFIDCLGDLWRMSSDSDGRRTFERFVGMGKNHFGVGLYERWEPDEWPWAGNARELKPDEAAKWIEAYQRA